MKIAYFINQYPKVSHSFIRREIVELENQGLQVARFSIRRDGSDIVDAGDKAELAKTTYLAEVGKLQILLMIVQVALTSPLRMMCALRSALCMGMRSHSGAAEAPDLPSRGVRVAEAAQTAGHTACACALRYQSRLGGDAGASVVRPIV